MNIPFLPAIIISLIIFIYGIFVFNGKLLWFLKDYKIRFRDENDQKIKRKSYKIYGVIIILLGIVLSVICLYQHFTEIDSIKNTLY